METLNNIVKTINQEIAFKSVTDKLLEQGLVLFSKAEKASFLLFDSEQQIYRFIAASGYELEALKNLTFSPAELSQRYADCMENVEEGIYIASRLNRSDHMDVFGDLPEPKAMIAMTLPVNEEQAGFLLFDSLTDPDAFHQSDIRKLVRFREHALTALTKSKVFEDLVATQKELIKEAHVAGMAEIAANVLHNLGNTLNSVRTSTHVIRQTLEDQNPIRLLDKVAGLIRENQEDIEAFLTQDPRGEKLPAFLEQISDKLGKEREQLQQETAKVDDHIKEIVGMLYKQHQYTHPRKQEEASDLNQLIQEAVRKRAYLLKSGKMEIVEDFQDVPAVHLQRAKFTYVLFYLLNNAREAIAEKKSREPGLIRLCTQSERDGVVVKIIDNGIGIPSKHLEQVFTFGFTTKKDHQGFGLHYCLKTLKEMSCSIEVESEGFGKGTEVTLLFSSEVMAGDKAKAVRMMGA